jgi:gamma-glutamyltranspeptidase / glutathione hydrolase
VSMEYGGGITTEVGPDSIAVPGAFAAFRRSPPEVGNDALAEVVGHVADVMEHGFPLPASCHYYLGYSGESVFGTDPASRRALFDGDRLRGPGRPW